MDSIFHAANMKEVFRNQSQARSCLRCNVHFGTYACISYVFVQKYSRHTELMAPAHLIQSHHRAGFFEIIVAPIYFHNNHNCPFSLMLSGYGIMWQ
jgi:hypothetical protein